MSFFNRLTAVVMAAALIAPVVPLAARTKRGDKYLAQGRQSEAKKDWDAALEFYEKAFSEDPSDIVYRMATEKARFQAAQGHVDKGMKVRSQGLLGEALLEFQKGYAINPGSAVAVQEIRRTQEMIQRERKRVEETGTEAPAQERSLTPAEEVKKEMRERIDRMLPVPELKPLNPDPIRLKMNSQPVKVLFETVGKLAGLNVLWDPEYQPPQKNSLSVEFDNSTIDQALDALAVLTKAYWKALSPNTIFVTNDTVNKRHDYEEQVARIFYLSNVTAQTDLQEIMNAARAVSDCQRMFPYNSQNAIIAKCEADRMAFVEKVINDLDKPRAEVVVDVLVLEASSTFSRQIAAALASTGLNVPVNFTPRSSIQVATTASTTGTSTTGTTTTGTTTTGTTTGTTASTTGSSIPLANLGHLASADFSTTLPGALLQAALSDARTKVLQAPQVRSVDGVKATLNIGDRVPTASGSFQPGIGGVGINPLVNTQFQYIDTGVNVEMLPRVHDNGDITIHVDLNINSVSSYVNLGGISQPVISQKKISHDIRMREGEVGLLGGLINEQENKTVTGIPGLSSIPVLRRLFTGDSVNRSRDELMIVLIPHVIRRPDITAENLRSIAVGNFATVKVNYAPKPAAPGPGGTPAKPGAEGAVALPATAPPATAPPATAPPATAPPATAPPATAQPATAPPATAPPETAPPATAPPATAPPATAPPATAPGPGGAPAPPGSGGTPGTAPAGIARVYFLPFQATAEVSGRITAGLLIAGGADVASAPIEIQFDPKFLRLNDVILGDFFSRDGQQPVFTKNILNDTGVAAIQLNRLPGSPGVDGSGTLVTLNFQAVARGATTVTIPRFTVRNSRGEVISSSTPQFTVSVK
ncbi:MAG: cohesin domain-containing protein [Bryobacteraceae bacterium]|jgi:general secretion pathway protein D